MAKQLSFSNESREALEKGVNFVANAVKVTIGPKAKNVVLEKKFGSPDIVRDGSTVAKEIEIENPISNLGAKLIEQVASKTKDRANMAKQLSFSNESREALEKGVNFVANAVKVTICLLYTSPSPRDTILSRMPSSA